MIRKTSSETYRSVSEYLPESRTLVYTAVFNLVKCTQAEVARLVVKSRHSISPRFSELVHMGLLEECGEKMCSVTNRMCIAYITTDNLYKKPIKKYKTKCKTCNGEGYMEQESSV